MELYILRRFTRENVGGRCIEIQLCNAQTTGAAACYYAGGVFGHGSGSGKQRN